MPYTDDMDLAATDAERELSDIMDEEAVKKIAQWWLKWYMKAGHKRLGRILVGIAKS